MFDRNNVVDDGDVGVAVATIQAASISERGCVGQEMIEVPEAAEPENEKAALTR